MNKFYWKKYQEPSDLALIKNEQIIEMQSEIEQAEINKDYKRAEYLRKKIKEIESV